MGMSIEDAMNHIKYGIIENNYPLQRDLGIEACNLAIDTMSKYQLFQVEYTKRLRDDMVAMLTELQLEIEELDSRAGYDGNGMPTFSTDYIHKKKVNELIQQKINSLKENKDGNNT